DGTVHIDSNVQSKFKQRSEGSFQQQRQAGDDAIQLLHNDSPVFSRLLAQPFVKIDGMSAIVQVGDDPSRLSAAYALAMFHPVSLCVFVDENTNIERLFSLILQG